MGEGYSVNKASMNHRGRHYLLSLSLIALGGLGLTVPSFASEPVLPAKSQAQTQTSQFVQPKIDQLIVEAVAVKRKTFAHEAIEVLAERVKLSRLCRVGIQTQR